MKLLIVIPHYNHLTTLKSVVRRCLAQNPNVAVFDDGSEVSPAEVLKGLPVTLVRFEKNRGKGAILQESAKWAAAHRFSHIVSIDADGQLDPAEYPLLAKAAEKNPHALIIGVRRFGTDAPKSSQFGRKFGGFWAHFQTGKTVNDIQSGYRCYPVEILNHIKCFSKRYAFEVEIAVRALWAGFPLVEVPVSVAYPKTRVSHFSKLKDNLRLTVLNTHLTVRSMLPIPHRQYFVDNAGQVEKRGYWEALVLNLKTPGNITKNALSAAWGIFCGAIALPGIRQLMLFGGAGWWNLNRILTISFEKFCIGPLVPALCIEVGFFLRYGRFLTEFNLTTLGRQFWQRVWEWVLGSCIVAPLLALCAFLVVWSIGYLVNRGLCAREK